MNDPLFDEAFMAREVRDPAWKCSHELPGLRNRDAELLTPLPSRFAFPSPLIEGQTLSRRRFTSNNQPLFVWAKFVAIKHPVNGRLFWLTQVVR